MMPGDLAVMVSDNNCSETYIDLNVIVDTNVESLELFKWRTSFRLKCIKPDGE